MLDNKQIIFYEHPQQLCENWGWFIDIDKSNSLPKRYKPPSKKIYHSLKPIEEEFDKELDKELCKELCKEFDKEFDKEVYNLCDYSNIIQFVSATLLSCCITYIILFAI
jgi:hypothetical protein